MLRSGSLALAFALLTGCVVDDDPPPLDTEVAALASDPAVFTSNGSCVNLAVSNGVHGRIYYPSNGGSCASTLVSPLVLVMPGYGFDETMYDDLARHLTRNRFIVVVVDTVAVAAGGVGTPSAAEYQAAANKAWSFVTGYATAGWTLAASIDTDHVALVGHSRGGEAVRYLAATLDGDPVYDVEAVVDLAGTDHTGKYIGSGDTLGALYIHGSKDGDVGLAKGVHAYDRTGIELSTNDPGLNPNVIAKDMKILVGGDHPSYTEKNVAAPFTDKPTQRAAAKGYVMAFLKAYLANDWTWYPDYVRGAAVPGGWASGVQSQHADGVLKRVVDHFEDANNALNALGGAVSKTAGIAWSSVNLGLDPDSPHATFAMALDVSAFSSVTWSVPAGKRDGSAFVNLSMRLGQRTGAPTTGVNVQIQNGGVWSGPQIVTNYGAIAQLTTICAVGAADLGPACELNATPTEPMSTIRIPLAAFGAHDDIQAIRLNFAGNAIGTQLTLDSLELAQWVLMP